MALIQLALNVFAVVLLAGASRAEVNCLPFQARVYLTLTPRSSHRPDGGFGNLHSLAPHDGSLLATHALGAMFCTFSAPSKLQISFKVTDLQPLM